MTLLQATYNIGPFEQLTQYGLAGLLILALGWLCYKFITILLDKQAKLEEFVMTELKTMNSNMVKVIDNNTNALGDIKEEQQELRKSIDTLNDKIQSLEKRA